MRRRDVLAAGVSVLAHGAAAQERQAGQEVTPVLFLHGDGGSAALWLPTIWRFESNTYPRGRLFALDMRLPSARRVDAVREPGRSSVEEATRQVAQEIARVRRVSGVERIALVAHGRAGNIVRNVLRDGDARIKAAVLCAPPSHGRIVSDRLMVGSEYNGASPILRRLNAMPGEVPPGVPTFTIASDRMDLWAQPDGRFLGLPGEKTGIGHDGPALRGATNVVLPGADHLEAAYSADAFVEIYRAVTGDAPQGTRVRGEVKPTLNGHVSGFEAGAPTNIGVPGARVRIFAVDPASGQRLGPERHDRVTAADGSWGPFEAAGDAHYEIELTLRGYPTTHIYRAPVPRTTEHLHLRPHLPGPDDPKQGSLVVVTRPRGFFDFGRDTIEVGSQAVGGEPGVPRENILRAVSGDGPPSPIIVSYNGARVTGRTWPIAERRVAVVEVGE